VKGQVLGESGHPRNKRRFVLEEFNGFHYLEIQDGYVNSSTGEWKKNKGVSISATTYGDLKSTILARDETIMDWIGKSYVPGAVEGAAQATTHAAEVNRYSMGSFSVVEYADARDQRFSRVEHLGGADELHFNTCHPLWAHVVTGGPAVLTLLCALVQSFAWARQRLAGAPADDSEGLIIQLEHEWARFAADAFRKMPRATQ
jgi:hypothetical protein